MQLIQLTEPGTIDIKKTMSTLEEAFESNQINGSIDHIENDPCAKISPAKNDTVSKYDEDVNRESAIKTQIEDTIRNLNGVAKTNGDTLAQLEEKTLALDNKKIEIEVQELTENRSSIFLNGQSNESSSDSNLCKSPTSTDISTMNMNKHLEEKHTIDSNEGLKFLNDVKITDVSLTDGSTGVDSIEKLPVLVALKAEVCKDQEVSDAGKLKNIEISIEIDEIVQNVPDFSPNSEVNEKEVNITAQLQQLENDDSMEKDDVNPPTDTKTLIDNESNTSEKVTQLDNHKPESLIQKHINEIPSSTTENKCNNDDITMEQEPNDVVNSLNNEADTHINGASTVSTTEKLPTENKNSKKNVLEKDLDTTEKNSNHLDTSFDGKSSVEKVTEEKLPMDVVDQNICDISESTNMRNDVSTIVIANQSVENDQNKGSSDVDMEVDTSKPIQEKKEENSTNIDRSVDETLPVHKYITVKKFTDMTYPAPPNDETLDNNQDIEVSNDKQPTEKDQSQQNEVMEVDTSDVVSLVTPDNCTRLATSNELPLVEKKTQVENNIEIADEEAPTEEKQRLTIEQKQSDNVVMELYNIDDDPVLENHDSGTEVDKDKAAAEVEDCKDTAKQDSVINIIDNDDEEKSDEPVDSEVKNGEMSEVISIDDSVKDAVSEVSNKPFSEIKIKDDMESNVNAGKNTQKEEKIPEETTVKQLPVVCKLSNTLDILSDEEDDLPFPPIVKLCEESKPVSGEPKKMEEQNKCINLDDDDDIMFIEDTNSQDLKDEENKSEQQSDTVESHSKKTTDDKVDSDTVSKIISTTQFEEDVAPKISEKDDLIPMEIDSQPKGEKTKPDVQTEINETQSLITKNFLKSVTKNLADMTRNELEDFCILKLVESVVDKSNLNEIKSKMKTMSQSIEDLRKKALALTKQNRDLQVVVKTVQEDQKKRNANPMMPMKITRSVGMQVVLGVGEKNTLKKKLTTPTQPPPMTPTRPARNMQSPKTPKPVANNIPVPRLVPASSPTVKSPVIPVHTAPKPTAPARNTQQRPEKRPHSKTSPASSVTVDLTDDEPPAKINTKNPAPPVRLVPSQNLLAPKPRPQFGPTGNSPRKVYIPISTHNQNVRPGQPVIKNFIPTPRSRQPAVVRMQAVRMNQAPSNRHPAPLPDAMKQYQPPTWKALPPAPDLKLSKVDNGIVISWKFEGYQPDTHEEVASFQLYAYQETPAPPSTAHWKKIGDIKALPLPMACTLTQFMSGFKYYFAVRAIDVRSRIGPFSLPGSIMLISKS